MVSRRPWAAQLEDIVSEFQSTYQRDPAILDWDTGALIAETFPQLPVFSPDRPQNGGPELSYLDHSIDLVSVPAGDVAILAEARRLAIGAVITFQRRGSDFALNAEWQENAAVMNTPDAYSVH